MWLHPAENSRFGARHHQVDPQIRWRFPDSEQYSKSRGRKLDQLCDAWRWHTTHLSFPNGAELHESHEGVLLPICVYSGSSHTEYRTTPSWDSWSSAPFGKDRCVVCHLQASHNRSNFLPWDFEYCSLSGNRQRICGSTWWRRAPKRLFSAGWSHMPHLEWEHGRNQQFFFFDDRIISKTLWPPRSPDLSPPDFFLWGALKVKAYANRPRTIQELENNIRREIAAISEDVLQATFTKMKRRVQLCLDSGGEHFQHLL